MELIKIKVTLVQGSEAHPIRINYPNNEIRAGYDYADAQTGIADLKEAIKELEKIGEN